MNSTKNSYWIKLQYAVSAIIFVCILALGIFHAMKGGINLTDEGLYFSAPYHYRFGVIPFKDAVHNATRQYDLLMAPVFILFPNITVLQFRIFGVLLHLSSIVAVFFLFSRFAPPLLIAASGAIFFLVNNFAGTPTPSYNVLVTAFGLWAFVLWMYGLLVKSSFRKIMLCMLSAIFLSFTIISNMSAGVILLVPLISSLFFLLKKRYRESALTAVIVAIVVAIFLAIGMGLFASGIWPYFWEALQNDANSSNLALGGVVTKMSRTWGNVLFVGFNSLYLAYLPTVIGTTLLWLIGRAKESFRFLLICLSIVAMFVLLIPVLTYPAFDFVLVVSSVLYLPIVFMYLQDTKGDERIVLILALLWGLIQVVSFGALSTNALQSTVKGAFLLFLLAMISMYRLYCSIPVDNQNETLKKMLVVYSIGLIMSFFAVKGIDMYVHTNYLELNYKKFTSVFKHPKLAGIYSEPDKTHSLEELLNYLKPKLRNGDYFLAYNDLPFLYYLTDTQPIYPNVWSFEFWWPLPYRTKLFQKMKASGKKAQYAVHMVTNPGYGWRTPVAAGVSFDLKIPGECLLCQYVENNYVLEKFMFPFEIWRLGKGERYEFLRNFNSYYEENFSRFMGKDRDLLPDESVPIASLWLKAAYGQYAMQTRKENGENIVRFVFNGIPSVYTSNLDIGYFSERAGFEFIPTSGEEVALTAKVRLSSRRSIHPYYSALLYIQDRLIGIDETTSITPEENSLGYPALIEKDSKYWQTNSAAIERPEWHEYAVTRTIRNGADGINFGVTWVPMNAGDWIEIKDMQFYTSDKNKVKK